MQIKISAGFKKTAEEIERGGSRIWKTINWINAQNGAIV